LNVRALFLWLLLALAVGAFGCTNRPAPSPADTPAASPGPTIAPSSPAGAGGPTTAPSATSAPPSPTAVPTATSAPKPPPTAVPPPAPAPPMLPHESFPAAPDRDLFQLAKELLPGINPDLLRTVNPEAAPLSQGRTDNFWLVDLATLRTYQSTFELRLVSPRAYWYVEQGLQVDQQSLESAAAQFEQAIYPKVTAIFGQEWSPGVDNDPRLTILNASLSGVAGYVSGADEFPAQVAPFSNQRELIYLNIRGLPVGSGEYLYTLAHELQHVVHWNADPAEETWVNEGLSELSAALASSQPRISFGRTTPEVSLLHWPLDQSRITDYYQAAALFMQYLWEHYRSENDFKGLLMQQANGDKGIDDYLSAKGASFRQVFQDWIVANFLDEPQGIYGYSQTDVRPRQPRSISGLGQLKSNMPQYAAQYVELTGNTGPLLLSFQGNPETPLLPVSPGDGGCWWSNSGDAISSSLTGSLDLAGLADPQIKYQVWHNIEKDWDYGYVEASNNGGRTWSILETPRMSKANPIGNSFGPGYTGQSRGWLDETISLAMYSGQQVLVRFHYVTDDAINGAGLCLRNIAAPVSGQGWQPQGFVLTNNRVRQEFSAQVMRIGSTNRVTPMALDASNYGQLRLEAPAAGERLVVAVAALAPKTLQPASYTLTVSPGG